MAGSPKDNEEKLNRITNAWKTLAADHPFAGSTLEQFQTGVQPSFTFRQELETLDDQRTHVINSREDADKASMAKAAAIVAGVLADPAFGPNSSLYEAMGYTRKDERKSGLHRGSSSGAPPSTGGSAPSTGGTPPPSP
jgi:hypothetical protein